MRFDNRHRRQSHSEHAGNVTKAKTTHAPAKPKNRMNGPTGLPAVRTEVRMMDRVELVEAAIMMREGHRDTRGQKCHGNQGEEPFHRRGPFNESN